MILPCNLEGIGLVDTEIAHGILDILMPKEELSRAQITGLAVDIRCLSAPE